MSKYAGIPFKCECCGGVFYELTAQFNPASPMRGDFVALLEKYGVNGFNWYDFPHNECTVGDNVACVQCGEPIRMGYVNGQLEVYFAEKEKNAENSVDEFSAILHSPSWGEGDGGQGSVLVDNGNHDDSCFDNDCGLYDNIDIEDPLIATILKMTAEGATQSTIAETCGITVYRVRKLQSGK